MPPLDDNDIFDGDDFTMDFEADAFAEDAPIGQPPVLGEETTPEETPKEKVDREEYERVQRELEQLKGRQAAYDEFERRRQNVAPAPTPEPARNDDANVAALRGKLKAIGQRLYDPDTSGDALEEFLNLTAQIGQAQAQQIAKQYAGNAVNTAADLMIENFMAKQSKKDELYDEVEPLVEAELAKYDKSAIAGMSRDQLLPAMEKIYKAARGDVLDAKWRAGKERAAKAKQQAAPNLGGGRSSGAAAPGGKPPIKISDATRRMFEAAGLSEDDMVSALAPKQDEDEW